MEVTRANETMIRGVAVFVRAGGLRRNAPSLPFRRPEAAESAFGVLSPGGGNAVVTGR